jgi:hypothetical protein
MSVGIDINDNATPAMREIALRVSPARLAAEVGPRSVRLVQRNFRSLGTNSRGWPSTHMYSQMAQATTWAAEAGAVHVDVNHVATRQRLLGGVITPQEAGTLTLPATPEAYGHRAREFSNLEFGFELNPTTGRMMPCLREARATVFKQTRRKDGTIVNKPVKSTTGTKVWYWLAGRVNQKPDPRVMPADGEWEREFDRSVDALVKTSTE